LRRRAEERRDPSAVAAHALDLGTPVLESAITLIDGGRLYYRGHDAIELSRSRSVGAVAALLWTGSFEEPAAPRVATARPPNLPRDLPFVLRAQTLLAAAAARDARAFDFRRDAVVETGLTILSSMTRAATLAPALNASIDAELAAAWRLKRGAVDVVRSALILCADHELNVSAFTARCVASAGASVYAAVIAGLSALEGVRHGGMTERVEAMLASMRHARSGRSAVAERLRQGEEIHGFGHPLYPDGDPRARELFGVLRARYPRSSELAFALDVADASSNTLGTRPSLDFGLAAVSRVLRLP